MAPFLIFDAVRDNWEHKETDFEEQLFTLLGVPWSFNYDTNRLYQLAITSNVSCDEAKSNPGAMYAKYATISSLPHQ